MTLSPFIGVIADDFTGAMDSGVQFAQYGLTTALAMTSVPSTSVLGTTEVVVLNTASREIAPGEARTRCAEAVERLKGRRLFKKIDSTLRGHLAAELEGLLSVAAGAKIVVCSAAPQQGRVIRDGLLYVNNVLLHESVFKNDPAFPAQTASVSERLGVASTHLPLATVRGPVEHLAACITAAPTAVITTDAVDMADLMQIGQAALLANAIPCGALGLANAWTQALTGRQPANPPLSLSEASGPVLIVAGSANASSHAQLARLSPHADSLLYQLSMPLQPGDEDALYMAMAQAWDTHRAIALCPAIQQTVRAPEWLTFGQTVSRLAAEVIRRRRPACLVIAGGETANQLCALLEVQAVELQGEAAPGIPYGRLIGGLADGLKLVTKAGGFGQEDCLERIIYATQKRA